MATTAAQIITAAFNKIRIDSPTDAQNASALLSLNYLINYVGVELLSPFLVRESYTLTVDDYDYTIGSGGNFDTVRPLKIERAFLRDADGYDYALKIMSPADYNDKSDKEVTSRPRYLYYLPEYPLGRVLFDSAPDYAYGLHIESWKPITEFALSTTTVESLLLPPEFKPFLIYNLAVTLAEDWDRVIPQSVLVMAERTKSAIERLLAAQKPVPRQKLDVTKGKEAGQYSVVTDEYIDGGSF